MHSNGYARRPYRHSVRKFLLYVLAALVVSVSFAASRGSETGKLSEPSEPVSAPADSAVVPSVSDSVAAKLDSAGVSASVLPVRMSHETSASDVTTTDSVPYDTTRVKVSRIRREKVDLEQAVDFEAEDSLVLINRNNAYMFGNSTVKYGEINLNAGRIEMLIDSSTVYAAGVVDTVSGELNEAPVFSDGSGEYESKEMRYNFKTERGYITDIITEQGEGYLTGAVTKKLEDGSFNLAGGRYTTCDDHENPHFYFQITKGKVRPKKNIVSGPAYMVLAGVPLPLAVPFGFFPFTKEYSSGIIFPSFGEDYNRGFYLREGGYYFAINDNLDLALRGEIYTKGSWGLSGRVNYVKRYKYRGSFDASFITTITGDKGSADYSKQNNFRITWSHQQDQKANPDMSLSASVNFTTSGYTRNDLNSLYNSSFTENTKSSTVNMTYRFPESRWSLSTTANITQRTQDSTLAVSFPNINVTMSQTAPFRRKRRVGSEKWYEKIKISYQGQIENSLTARQDEFFKKSLVKDWRNGVKHYMPVSATFNLFNYINVSPSITLNDRMYFRKVNRSWDPNSAAEVCDTTNGFYNLFDFNASVSMDTKIYGFWKPLKIFGDKVQMIRHVLTPTVSFSASPDFSAPMWGVYGSYDYVDNQGVTQTRQYNHFDGAVYGTPGRGKTGMVTMSLANNLEMKVRSDKDSTGIKKISLIENLSISQSYNFAADSLRWSNIETSLLLRLTRNFNLNLRATWDPYTYGLSSSGSPVRINKTRLQAGKGFAKLASTGTSFSYTFNNDTFKRGGSANKDDDDTFDRNYGDDVGDDEAEDDYGGDFAARAQARRDKNKKSDDSNADADGYEPWSVPWSLSFNYSLNYSYGDFDYDKMDYKGKWTQNLSFNGSIRPTQNWNIAFSASYDFTRHKIAYANCSISRDLHCFTMSCSFVPVGPYKSYNFHIAVKSSLLKDFKYDKRSSTSNGVQWY